MGSPASTALAAPRACRTYGKAQALYRGAAYSILFSFLFLLCFLLNVAVKLERVKDRVFSWDWQVLER